jgi:hypothetical protein
LALALCGSALLVQASAPARAQTRVEGARDLIGDAPLARPPVVFVYDFALAGADGADAERLRAAQQGAANLSRQIVEELGKEGIAARRADAEAPVPVHALVIKGSIPQLDQGDRMTRAVVGMGAGAAEIRSRFEISQQTRIAQRLLWQADTVTHEGGKTPGLGASGAAAAVTGRTTGLLVRAPQALIRAGPVEIHTYRTSKIIDEGLARRYRSRGWR